MYIEYVNKFRNTNKAQTKNTMTIYKQTNFRYHDNIFHFALHAML